MIAVVISHNQKESIEPMRNAIDVPTLFVLDRCTDGSQEKCKRLGVDFITNEIGSGRQVSRARNLGANKFPNDDILFLDGDRIPLFPVSQLEQSTFGVTLVKSETDVRDRISQGSWVEEPLWGTFHNGLFSSCVLIRRLYIDQVIADYGHLFDEEFTEWGEEDRHLGDLLWAVGASCGFADNSWRVSGRSTMKEEKAAEFANMSQLRVRKLFGYGMEFLIR